MTQRIYIKNLIRLTLTRKGRSVAKHPLLRNGVIEAVKATPSQNGTKSALLWEKPATDSLSRWRNGNWG